MFGGETVVYGYDNRVDVVCEVYAEVVKEISGCTEEDETATVEVNDEREFGEGGVIECFAG